MEIERVILGLINKSLFITLCYRLIRAESEFIMTKNTKFDIYETVTNRIIEKLESGRIPWAKPWGLNGVGGAYSGATGKPYSLLNQLGLEEGEYWTFKQVTEHGGKVKKGAHGNMVLFWKFMESEVDVNGVKEVKKFPILRYYTVFNVNDCEGITAKHAPKVVDTKKVDEIKACEKVLKAYTKREKIKYTSVQSDEAFYRPATDSIHMPLINQFHSSEEYYSTAFHECVHSTGHKDRLARLEKHASFGSELYSKEELVAEIGACAILNSLGVETDKTFTNSAAYCQSWIKALKNDPKMIVSAAGKAEKAMELILDSKVTK